MADEGSALILMEGARAAVDVDAVRMRPLRGPSNLRYNVDIVEISAFFFVSKEQSE